MTDRPSHLQLLRRPRGPAGVRCSKRSSAIWWRCRASACRFSRSATGRRRSSRSSRRPRPTSATLAAFPSNYKVLFLQGGASLQFSMVPMNLLTAGRDRRLHRLRIVGREGDQGSEERRQRQRRRHDQGRELLARAAAGRAEADAGRRIRPHDVEQHDRRHRVQGAAGGRRRAARQRHLVRHVQPADRRRPPRADLFGRAEEHGPCRRHRRHRPRRHAAALDRRRCRRC